MDRNQLINLVTVNILNGKYKPGFTNFPPMFIPGEKNDRKNPAKNYITEWKACLGGLLFCPIIETTDISIEQLIQPKFHLRFSEYIPFNPLEIYEIDCVYFGWDERYRDIPMNKYFEDRFPLNNEFVVKKLMKERVSPLDILNFCHKNTFSAEKFFKE